jgi:murein DD-endopeptidase MepM/ murein hydrolase activator NlpD
MINREKKIISKSCLIGFTLFLSACFGPAHNPNHVNVHMHGLSKPAHTQAVRSNVLTVQKGDTLYALSKRHNTSLRGLIDQNHLQPPYALSVGQKLSLPKMVSYKVQKGDTLYSISKTFSVSQAQIVSMNGMKEPYSLHLGQELNLGGTSSNGNYRVIETASTTPPKQISRQVSAAHGPVRPQPKPVFTPTARAGGKFSWPASGRILSGFGPKAGGLHNDGINIAAPRGTPVKAAENGVVAYAGNELKGFGNLVLIKHSDGYMTAYAHLDKITQGKGTIVKKGQNIATIGTSGGMKTPQLHFELRRGKKPINPNQFLSG